MSNGVFGRFIAVVLLLVLLIMLSLGVVIVKLEKARNTYSREVVESFFEDIMRDGDVTVEEWESMIAELDRAGVLYDIEVSVGRVNKGREAE